MRSMDEKKEPRARRNFTDEFKAGAVGLMLDEGKAPAKVARDLDLTPSVLSTWVRQARVDRTRGKTGPATATREELSRLPKEVGERKIWRYG